MNPNRIVNQLELLANQFPQYFAYQYNKALNHAQAINSTTNNPYNQEKGKYSLAEAEVDEQGILQPNEQAKQRITDEEARQVIKRYASGEKAQAAKARKRTKKGSV